MVIATKVGARPLAPSLSFGRAMDGPSAKAIRESAQRSMARPGVSRLDLMYAHIEDPSVPAEETVGASSVAQLEESLAAVDLELTEAQRARLDEAR